MKTSGLLEDLRNPVITHISGKYDRDFWDLDIEHAEYFSPLLSIVLKIRIHGFWFFIRKQII